MSVVQDLRTSLKSLQPKENGKIRLGVAEGDVTLSAAASEDGEITFELDAGRSGLAIGDLLALQQLSVTFATTGDSAVISSTVLLGDKISAQAVLTLPDKVTSERRSLSPPTGRCWSAWSGKRSG